MILAPESQIQEYTSRGWWGTETVIDKLYQRAAEMPAEVALVDPDNKQALLGLEPMRLSYQELINGIDSLALKLVEMGVERDDVVMVQLPNVAELTITLLAASRAGAMVSPLPVQWRKHELKHAFGLTDAKVFVSSHDFMGFDHLALAREALEGKASDVGMITVGHGPADHAVSMSDILSRVPENTAILTDRRPSANDVFTLCWTSGTEAAPKAVPRSHNHWLAISAAVVESFLPDTSCVYLSLFPTINMAGLGAVLVPWIITGGKMVLHHPFDLKVFLKQLIVEKVYYTLAPPALLDNLAKSPDWAAMDKGDLSVIGSGSAPLSSWMVKKFQEDFGISIVNFFASNEGVALYSCPRDFPNPEDRALYFPRFGRENLTWDAKASEGFRTRLVDPISGEEVTEPDLIGELRFAGPTIFPGYYKAPELTDKAFDQDGYFLSGDLFSIAGDNMEKYRFHGRHKDLIIRGGQNISPEEIETLVVEHPKVAEVAALGYPDDRLGERICIVVAPKAEETVTLDEINEFLRTQDIAKYKYPEKLKLVEALPRNPLGKVLKRELRTDLS